MPFSRHWEVSGQHIARRLAHSDNKQFSLRTGKAKFLFSRLFVLDLPWKALYHRSARLMLKSMCVIRRRIDGLPTGVAVAVARLG